jgi:1,4-dihydroxy-2-naphthoate octaprenyltransferase
MVRWKAWIEVIRVKFFLAGVPSTFLGASLAWYMHRKFDAPYFFLSLFGILLSMVGCYTFNEYFDFKSGVDVIIRQEDITPFSAGSRVLPKRQLNPYSVFKAGVIAWALAFIIGLYLTLVRGWLVMLLALLGFFTGALYTLPPFKWAYRGLGEVFIGLTYGPLITFGSYYVQAAELPLHLISLPSLVPGLLITAVIWINEFPDYFADMKAGKRNMVVRLGRKRASKIYTFLILASYTIPLLGALLQLLPLTTLATLVTLPIAYKGISIVKGMYEDSKGLIPAMAITIFLFASSTLLLASAYVLAAWITL